MKIYNLISAFLLASVTLAWDIKIDIAMFQGPLLWSSILVDIFCSVILFVGALVPWKVVELLMDPKVQEIVLARIEAEDKATGEAK